MTTDNLIAKRINLTTVGLLAAAIRETTTNLLHVSDQDLQTENDLQFIREIIQQLTSVINKLLASPPDKRSPDHDNDDLPF